MKAKRLINKKITQSAKGEECTVRIIGVCNFNSETTVFAHLGGAGMGLKSHDIHGSYCCSSCHDVLDGRIKTKYNKVDFHIKSFCIKIFCVLITAFKW